MTEQKIRSLKVKLSNSRARLLLNLPFFGIILMNMSFFASSDIKKCTTNGKTVFFNPSYFTKLHSYELDYLLCHLVMHTVLEHIWRPEDFEGEKFHHACDIAVNSRLLNLQVFNRSYPHFTVIHRYIIGTYDPCYDKNAYEIFEKLHYNIEDFSPNYLARQFIDTDEAWGKTLCLNGTMIIEAPYITVYSERDKSEQADCKALKSETKAIVEGAIEHECDGNGSGNGESILSQLNITEKEAKNVNWKKELQAYLQSEICDYSFTPPDRRFADLDVFLPDYNERDVRKINVYFAVDTSGSISRDQLSAVYAELRSIINMLQGKLNGKLIFFDTHIIGPYDMSRISHIEKLIPHGGGGTSIYAAFQYIKSTNENPDCIMIFTDGYDIIPNEEDTDGIPVVWLINNDHVTPEYGKIIRIID